MAYMSDHGGGCCGRRHLTGMNGATTESIRHDMRNMLQDGINKITEIVISEENLNYEDVKRQTVAAGFVLVAEWENNSGSTCWMYLHANYWTAFPNGVPVQPVAPPAPVIQRVEVPIERPRRELGRQFRNVFANGRRGGWYDTLAGCADAAPNCLRYEERAVFSDGYGNPLLNQR